MTTQHTPGPWRYWTQRRPNGEDTCTFRNLDGAEVLRAVTVTLTEADARLIAAAPELLKALTAARSMLAICAGPIPSNDELRAIEWSDAAITKATGEIP